MMYFHLLVNFWNFLVAPYIFDYILQIYSEEVYFMNKILRIRKTELTIMTDCYETNQYWAHQYSNI